MSAIIDSAVEYCDLEKWQAWTGRAFSPIQQWPKERPDAIWDFRQKVIAAIWPPGYEELKRATVSFSIFIHLAAQKFLEYSEPSGNIYVADRFYKRSAFNPNYHEQLDEFEQWQSLCDKLLKDATKAANWFADVVRRDINPMFFATHGKFLIMEGPLMDLSFRTSLLEFIEEEKTALPADIGKAI